MRLAFEIDGQRWLIACDPARAPRTLAAVAACLPLELQLHTPKIAGSHVYWHAPFVEDVEGGVDVMQARPGAFIYWPVRQFLEITFAPLQAETASISVLGHLEGGLEALTALGLGLREGHGRRLFAGRLTQVEAAPGLPAPAAASGVPADIAARRRALWTACPEELRDITASRAIMHPAGPLLMAESELRTLHEALWWVRERLGRDGETVLRYAAALACNRTGVRVRDFCHLAQAGALLLDVEAALLRPDVPLAAMVEEAILISGRLAAWLDLLIPWSDVNEAMRAALPPPIPAPATGA
ncbi:hypothetical protein [Labrys wisconsinensis]|uniref:Uncharacterized protein n=1 Tax=Labrys wisconsinensis TaxID=425677 RepID=A0ABU0J2S6_9HYPH|nr:hypothetical protein [Labrys wisconsinensis]MDQ0467925.1 hypothetical protein [Labrys wisconsinensis]